MIDGILPKGLYPGDRALLAGYHRDIDGLVQVNGYSRGSFHWYGLTGIMARINNYMHLVCLGCNYSSILSSTTVEAHGWVITSPLIKRVKLLMILQWRHNGSDGVSNHQPHHCWLNRLFRRRSKKTSKLRVTGLCLGNSPVTGEFPAHMASNAENVSIWWRHHEIGVYLLEIKVN